MLQTLNHFSTFPPDFCHGTIALESVYEAYGETWVENAVFVVVRDGQTAWAAFNDYFLETGAGEIPTEFAQRASTVVLGINEDPGFGSVRISCDAQRLVLLEKKVLGAFRESDHHTTDLLSFVGLCGALGFERIEEF